MAWAFVASTNAIPASGTASSVVGVQFGSNNTAGNTIVASATRGGTTAGSTLTDSQGNTWAIAKEINDGVNGASLAVGHALNIIGGTASSVVMHFTSGGFRGIAVHEYSGVASMDVSVGQAGTGTAATSTLATTTADGDLLYGAITNDGGTSTNASSGAGYTRRTFGAFSAGGAYALATEDQSQATAGSTAAKFTQNASDGYICIMAAYKITVAGGNVVNPWTVNVLGLG